MTELLSTAPEILSIGQEHVPEHLRGRTLIFYIKDQDVVVLAGWGEHTAALMKIITEYLGLLPSDQEGVVGMLRDMGFHDMAIELFEALGRIYQDRSREET